MMKRGFLTGVVAGVASLLAVGAVRAAADARGVRRALSLPLEPDAPVLDQTPIEVPYHLMPHVREIEAYVGGEDFPADSNFVLWLANVEYALWHTVKGSILDTPNPGLFDLWRRGENATDVARALIGYGRDGAVSP